MFIVVNMHNEILQFHQMRFPTHQNNCLFFPYRHVGHLQPQNEVRKRRVLSAQMAQATDSALVAEENHTWQSAKGLYVYCKRMNFHSEHTIDE